MKKKLKHFSNILCPHCNKALYESELKNRGYKYQCFDCDEDFFDFEVIKVKK